MSTTAFDALPQAARNMLAYSASLEQLGFQPNEFTFAGTKATHPSLKPTPPGDVLLVITLRYEGKGFQVAAGFVVESWWTGGGWRECTEAWNALSQEERTNERIRGMPAPDFLQLSNNLIAAGIVPPKLTSKLAEQARARAAGPGSN